VFFRWYDITQLRLQDLRSAIAYVPKTVSYLALLSKNNIRYGDPLAEQLEVEYSANLPRFIQKFSTFRNNKQLSVSVALPYLADNGRERFARAPAADQLIG